MIARWPPLPQASSLPTRTRFVAPIQGIGYRAARYLRVAIGGGGEAPGQQGWRPWRRGQVLVAPPAPESAGRGILGQDPLCPGPQGGPPGAPGPRACIILGRRPVRRFHCRLARRPEGAQATVATAPPCLVIDVWQASVRTQPYREWAPVIYCTAPRTDPRTAVNADSPPTLEPSGHKDILGHPPPRCLVRQRITLPTNPDARRVTYPLRPERPLVTTGTADGRRLVRARSSPAGLRQRRRGHTRSVGNRVAVVLA